MNYANVNCGRPLPNYSSMLKRLVHAFVALSFGQAVVIFSNIVLVPMYLRVWTPAVYGEWLAISSVVMYLSNLDLGMQTYVLNRLTQSYARHDMKDYREQQHSAVAFYIALAIGGTVLLVTTAEWAPITRWFKLTYTLAATARVVFVLLGAQILLAQLGTMFFSIYRTTGRVAMSQWIANGYRLLNVAVTILALLRWRTLPAVAAAQLSLWVVAAAVIVWDLHYRFPELTPGISGAKFSIIQQQLRPSVLFGVIALAMALGVQGANLVVVGTLGGAALALFATSRTLVNSIRQLVSICTNAAWTDVTRMEAVGEHERLRLALRLVVIISTAVCIMVGSPLWFEGPSVIRVWTSNRLVPDTILLRLLLAYVILQTPWTAASLLPMSTNRNTRLATSYVVANTIGIGLAVVLVRSLGMAGVPVGLILGEAIGCYHFVLAEACRIAAEPYWRFATRVWIGIALLSAISIFADWNVHRLHGMPTVVRWTLSGLVSIVVVSASTWFAWLPPSDRQFLKATAVYGWDRLLARTASA